MPAFVKNKLKEDTRTRLKLKGQLFVVWAGLISGPILVTAAVTAAEVN